jgi:hypothetical protein
VGDAGSRADQGHIESEDLVHSTRDFRYGLSGI